MKGNKLKEQLQYVSAGGMDIILPKDILSVGVFVALEVVYHVVFSWVMGHCHPGRNHSYHFFFSFSLSPICGRFLYQEM